MQDVELIREIPSLAVPNGNSAVAADLLNRQRAAVVLSTNRVFVGLLLFEWLAAVVVAVQLHQPGATSVQAHVWTAVVVGALLAGLPTAAVHFGSSRAATRHIVAACQVAFSGLFIHLTGGHAETHFHIFASLAFLAFYRDPWVLLTATAVALADTLLVGVYMPLSVFGTPRPRFWLLFEHSFWALFEDFFLVIGMRTLEKANHEAAKDKVRELNGYRIVRLIGSGGMGDVLLAEHRLLKRPCAIKLVRQDRVRDPQTLARFEREVQTMAQLSHPNTVTIYDYGHLEDGTFFYVMEYVPGLTLADVVTTRGPLSPERVVFLLRQVCGALAEAHSIGFVHRDIKPENILICNQGAIQDTVKLIDFGLVQRVEAEDNDHRLTSDGAILGTPAYMSPEQASGDKIGPGSDIYSLGLVAYFMLTAELPFQGKNPLAQLSARLKLDPASPSRARADMPADLEGVLVRATRRDPADRFADAQAFRKALGKCTCAGKWDDDSARGWWQVVDSGAVAPVDAASLAAHNELVRSPTVDDPSVT